MEEDKGRFYAILAGLAAGLSVLFSITALILAYHSHECVRSALSTYDEMQGSCFNDK